MQSISAHLSPEPERRLRLILDDMTRSVGWADLRIGALTAFAAAEAAFVFAAVPAGPAASAALAALGAALPLGILGFTPLTWVPRGLAFIDPPKTAPLPLDILIAPESLAGCSRRELTIVLDRYLGGGITATPYFEDLVAMIISAARASWRKQRLFNLSCILVGSGQIAILFRLVWR